jgi:antitoxin HicB
VAAATTAEEKTMDYRVVLEPDDNGTILVSFPDFPEAHTFGETKAEALARAEDALATVIQAYIADRRPIPKPSAPKKKDARFTLPVIMAIKLALYRSLLETHTTKYALAKKLGWHLPQVDRLFDVRHRSRLDQLEAAAKALGKRVEVHVA